MEDRSSRRKDYLAFTALFCVVGLLVFAVFILERKSFIWSDGIDGINQHFPAFVYEGVWLRDIARSILAGRPEIKLWDYTIGYGSDVISTMSYYALGDPLNLISAVVPTRFAEYAFDAIVVTRLWIAGICFILYAHTMDHTGTKVLAGALSYVFSGFATYTIIRHPFFNNTLIYLPLLLTGIERFYRKKRSDLFVASIFLAAIGNYYFFYMLAICVAGYALVRFFTLEHRHIVREFFATGFSFIVLALLGVGCAGLLLVPTLTQLLSNSRASSTLQYEHLYPISYYTRFFPSLFSSAVVDRWKCLGFSGPALLGVTCLIADRKRHPFLLGLFVFLTALFLIPAVGSILNGMSYVTNRWSFAYTFFVCYILVLEWDTLVGDPTAQIPAMAVTAIVVLVCFTLGINYGGDRGASQSLALYMAAMIIVVLVPSVNSWRFVATHEARARLLLLFVTAGLVANGYYLYSRRGTDSISEELDFGMGLQLLTDTPWADVREAADGRGETELVRVECPNNSKKFEGADAGHETRNLSMFAHVSSTQYYWSVVNDGTSRLMIDYHLPWMLAQKVSCLDGRTAPVTLAGVNYVVGSGYPEPYGFSPIEGNDRIYTSDYSLPIGYTYSSVMPESEVEDQPATKRQEAMMQAAIVSDEDLAELSQSLKTDQPVYEAKSVPVELTMVGDINQIDDTHFLARKYACIEFHFEGLENSETYLSLRGYSAEPRSEYDLYTDDQLPLTREQYDAMSTIKKHKLWWDGVNNSHWNNSEYDATVYLQAQTTKAMTWYSPYAQWTDNNNDFLINLGYQEEAQNVCSISLDRAGLYTIEDIQIICQPMDHFHEQVDALREDSLEDIWYATNAFGGTITLDSPKLLCLAMPNEKGWSAQVDGQDAKIYSVNTMFMGLMLEPGTHEIKLTYRTHLLLQSLLVSLGCFALAVGLQVWERKRLKKQHLIEELAA